MIFTLSDIVHENLKMGSDGESDQASGTSSDEVQSPTGVCLRNRIHRRISMEVRHAHVHTLHMSCLHGRSTFHPLSSPAALLFPSSPPPLPLGLMGDLIRERGWWGGLFVS